MAKKLYTEDYQPQQPADIPLRDGVNAVGSMAFELVDKPVNQDYIDEIAFMEEEMEILLQESSNENDENPVMVGNNGQYFQFWRGKPVTAKRKFVDCLIVKTGRVSTPKVRNGAGEDAYAVRQQSAHKYPFMVIRDTARGNEWLKRRLSEAI